MCIPALLKTRRFLPLFLTQFLGAFNDNLFKNALVILITYRLAERTGQNAQMLVTAAAAIFMLPYVLFSGLAGQVADKFSRSKLARVTKLWELFIVSVAAVGFYLEGTYFLLFVLFCLGVQATMFGPIKYALLPQHLRDDELVAGNAFINGGTFLAILIGTITGGLLILAPGGDHLMAMGMIAVSLAGYAASRHIPDTPPANPDMKLDKNLFRQSWQMVAHDRKNRRVFRCIMGISWFWLLGATYLSQFPTLAKDVLHADETVVTFFLTLFSIGIAAGSGLCSWILGGQISHRTVRWGALGLSLFTIDLYFATRGIAAPETLSTLGDFLARPESWRVLIDLLGVPVSAGLFIVPLYAIMQHATEPTHRARTVASNNFINAFFMVLSGLLVMVMLGAQFTVPEVFLTLGIVNLGVVFYTQRI